MRVSLGISTACLAAAGIVSPLVHAQTAPPPPAPPRMRSAQAIVIQKGGGYYSECNKRLKS